jgi:hypothetical protein
MFRLFRNNNSQEKTVERILRNQTARVEKENNKQEKENKKQGKEKKKELKQAAKSAKKGEKADDKYIRSDLINNFKNHEVNCSNILDNLFKDSISKEHALYKQSKDKKTALKTSCRYLNEKVIEPFERRVFRNNKLKQDLLNFFSGELINSIELLIRQEISAANPSSLKILLSERTRLVSKREKIKEVIANRGYEPYLDVDLVALTTLVSFGLAIPVYIAFGVYLSIDPIKKSLVTQRINDIDKTMGVEARDFISKMNKKK